MEPLLNPQAVGRREYTYPRHLDSFLACLATTDLILTSLSLSLFSIPSYPIPSYSSSLLSHLINSLSSLIMAPAALINANPTVYETTKRRRRNPLLTKTSGQSQGAREVIDQEEIYGRSSTLFRAYLSDPPLWYSHPALRLALDLVRTIADPEHPMTLEQLAVVNAEHITVSDDESSVVVEFTPTIPHCSMATLIGLCIRVRLLRALPHRFKTDIYVREGTHQSEKAVNKQLNDKERVAAAMENKHLLEVVDQCLAKCDEMMLQEAEEEEEEGEGEDM